jgi:F-type H+-transporting ATPase subunit gamma
MAKARALDKRRKSIRNIRKITRTMELIATARFKKAMERAVASTAYTRRITQLVADLSRSGLTVSHPLLEPRETSTNGVLLVLTANRGLCGGYNASVARLATQRFNEMKQSLPHIDLEVSGKRGIAACRYRNIPIRRSFTQFEDQPKFSEVEPIANAYLDDFLTGKLDRLEVVYTKFLSVARQVATHETLLPFGELAGGDQAGGSAQHGGESQYEFLPSAESILAEVVPTSFKVKLFKCFLDAAVSEQTARMVAMKAATENAGDMIKSLSRTYNRARQSQITNEIMEVIGGAEALKGS